MVLHHGGVETITGGKGLGARREANEQAIVREVQQKAIKKKAEEKKKRDQADK